MKLCLTLALLAFIPTWTFAGAPLVSLKNVPSRQTQERLWQDAIFEVLLDGVRENPGRTEPARMLALILSNSKMGIGHGWFEPGQSRYDWTWLKNQRDRDRDGRITSAELGSPELFERLDRDKDGAITADDLDWSEQSTFLRQEAQATQLFRMMNTAGTGQLSADEWQGFFKKIAQGKEHLTPDDLRQALFALPPRGTQKAKSKSGPGAELLLSVLWQGDLGSPFVGPRIGQSAPDFTLPTHDGKAQRSLSSYRGKKPVVLIFGSFT